jgi:hypothetical protein
MECENHSESKQNIAEEGAPAARGKIRLCTCLIRILQKIAIIFPAIIIMFLYKSYSLSSLRREMKWHSNLYESTL